MWCWIQGISETYYSIEQIVEIVGGQLILNDAGDNRISDLLTDSRKIVHPENFVFIVGERHDGHKSIQELVVQEYAISSFPNTARITMSSKANFLS